MLGEAALSDENLFEMLARVDAVAKLLPVVVAELVKRLPDQDRETIVAMLNDLASAMDAANQMVAEGTIPDPRMETGTRYLRLEIRRLLSRIDDPPAGADG